VSPLNRTQTLSYDGLGRLESASSGPYGNIDYDYDGNGNRLSEDVAGQAEIYTYDPLSHRLLQTENGGSKVYAYDANGNTTSNPDRNFVYGNNNRLSEVKIGGTPIANYTYNGRGERVIKTVPGRSTGYLYGLHGELLAETNATNAILKEYVYLEGTPIAVFDYDVNNDGLADCTPPKRGYIHTDHLGTPVLIHRWHAPGPVDGLQVTLWVYYPRDPEHDLQPAVSRPVLRCGIELTL